MVLKSLFSLLTVIALSSVWGQENFVQFDLDSAEYSSVGDESSDFGSMKFRQMNLSWNNINVGITNNDEIFNSKIVRRKNFFGLVGKNLNVGIKLESTDLIDNIKELSLKRSNILVNPLFLSFNGLSFKAKTELFDFSLKNFNIYCQGSNIVDMTGLDGLAKGCLNNSFLNVTDNVEKKVIKLEAIQANDDVFISSQINDLELSENRVKAKTSLSRIDIPGYIIEAEEADFDCFKEVLDLENLDFDPIFKNCNNDFKAFAPKIVLKDKAEETRFFGQLKKAVSLNERVQFVIPEGQVADKTSSTTLLDLDLRCLKNPDNSIFDLHDMIGDCLKFGSIQSSHVISVEDNGKTFNLYKDIISRNLNPVKGVKKSDASLKNLQALLKNNELSFSAEAKIPLLGFKKISFKANTIHDKKNKTITIDILSAKLPLGIRSVKFLMNQLKKNLVGTNIEITNNRVTIKL